MWRLVHWQYFCSGAKGTRVLISAAAMIRLSWALVVRGQPGRERLFRVLRLSMRVRKLDTVRRGICNWRPISASIIDSLRPSIWPLSHWLSSLRRFGAILSWSGSCWQFQIGPRYVVGSLIYKKIYTLFKEIAPGLWNSEDQHRLFAAPSPVPLRQRAWYCADWQSRQYSRHSTAQSPSLLSASAEYTSLSPLDPCLSSVPPIHNSIDNGAHSDRYRYLGFDSSSCAEKENRKRKRQLVGKGLDDKTNLTRCEACGEWKLLHTLCGSCVKSIQRDWRRREQ
jgi:ribosomal protein L32